MGDIEVDDFVLGFCDYGGWVDCLFGLSCEVDVSDFMIVVGEQGEGQFIE